MKKRRLFFAVLLAGIAGHGFSIAEPKDEVVVIVNKGGAAGPLGREDLRPMFQTTKMQWPDGTKVDPINLPDDNPVRQSFDSVILGLDPERVARYWIDRKIRGGERPPRKLSSPGAVVRAVAADKGAVGYVVAADANDSVRVVARIRNGQVVSP